ncbi:unnamed protein product [Euphydryas editha]|uniref:Uncharacterized protein n=1 Tax=Euphydryas editha TaxID=104508 RepID=A0AAU9VBE7_EUPED|nr:unnamed protein product [Euphydryas editha]
MALKYIMFIICIGIVWAQSEPSLSDAINKLPPELQGQVDEKQVNELKNKSMQAFKKKCEDNGGPNAYPQIEESKHRISRLFVRYIRILIFIQEQS